MSDTYRCPNCEARMTSGEACPECDHDESEIRCGCAYCFHNDEGCDDDVPLFGVIPEPQKYEPVWTRAKTYAVVARGVCPGCQTRADLRFVYGGPNQDDFLACERCGGLLDAADAEVINPVGGMP